MKLYNGITRMGKFILGGIIDPDIKDWETNENLDPPDRSNIIAILILSSLAAIYMVNFDKITEVFLWIAITFSALLQVRLKSKYKKIIRHLQNKSAQQG